MRVVALLVCCVFVACTPQENPDIDGGTGGGTNLADACMMAPPLDVGMPYFGDLRRDDLQRADRCPGLRPAAGFW